MYAELSYQHPDDGPEAPACQFHHIGRWEERKRLARIEREARKYIARNGGTVVCTTFASRMTGKSLRFTHNTPDYDA